MSDILTKAPLQQYSIRDTLKFKHNVIDKWDPESEIWALKFGDEILGAIAACGGIYVTRVFRKYLKIRPFATMTTFAPVVGLSALGVYLFQSNFVTSPVIGKNSCPSCITTRSVVGEVLFGVGYPLIMAPLVCFYVADRLLTYPIPPIRRAPKETFILFRNIVMKNPKPLYFLGAIHMAAALLITSIKYQNMKNLDLKYKYRPYSSI